MPVYKPLKFSVMLKMAKLRSFPEGFEGKMRSVAAESAGLIYFTLHVLQANRKSKIKLPNKAE
jgi:hypothetical protein